MSKTDPITKCKAIYEPKGRAKEYSELALNLYDGCSHGCRYCYAPRVMRKKPADWFKPGKPRKDIMNMVKHDAKLLEGDPRRVLMCFTSDPFQRDSGAALFTIDAIQHLAKHDIKMNVLTKDPWHAVNVGVCELGDVHLGTTLHSLDESTREKWEPGAPSISSRIEGLALAHYAGVKTWISMEPVIDYLQGPRIVHACHEFVDFWKVGKMNYHPEVEKKIPWDFFLETMLQTLTHFNCNYYIKDDLWKFADDEIKAKFEKQVGGLD